MVNKRQLVGLCRFLGCHRHGDKGLNLSLIVVLPGKEEVSGRGTCVNPCPAFGHIRTGKELLCFCFFSVVLNLKQSLRTKVVLTDTSMACFEVACFATTASVHGCSGSWCKSIFLAVDYREKNGKPQTPINYKSNISCMFYSSGN